MIFIILVLAAIALPIIVGIKSSGWDRGDNIGITIYTTLLILFFSFLPSIGVASSVGSSNGDAKTYDLIETDGYYLAAGYDDDTRVYNFLREDDTSAFVGDSTPAAKARIAETSGSATATYTDTYSFVWWYQPWKISGQSVTSFEVPTGGVLETSR